mmetsp:Transcript_67406/g.161678  ORF Transcript_67406/g.161678 Transcript_67406/m.161678 type:complete len:1142 (-) Transcript_67406:61-3486(-)
MSQQAATNSANSARPVVHQGAVAGQTPVSSSSLRPSIDSAAATTDVAALTAMRDRSASPGQFGSQSYAIRSAAGSHGVSPRTPRQTQAASDLRLSVAVAEIHRQAEAERKSMSRQLHHLEKLFQDQLSEPVMKRERWADLQGSVSGILEEVASLGKRIEALDERLRVKTSACEELARQKVRELEQQMYAQDHKSQLASSTAEEVMKRQSAKVKKLVGIVEEHTRRLDVLEAGWRSNGGQHTMLAAPNSGLETRIYELEQRQTGLEDDFRGLAAVAIEAQNKAVVRSLASSPGRSPEGGENGHLQTETVSIGRRALTDGGESEDSAILSVQRDLTSLSNRLSAQLDEHATTIAKLKVRSESQEQRLSAATERVETIVAPPLEALRSELAQLRQQDWREMEVRLEHMSRRVQTVADASEETATEVRDQVRSIAADLKAVNGSPESTAVMQKLTSSSAAHDQALRRLEATMRTGGSQPQIVSEEEFCRLSMRADLLEQRLDSIEQSKSLAEVSGKADRSELSRIERELADSLRRVSQRAATCEAKAAAVEQRLEQMPRGGSGTNGSDSSAVTAATVTIRAQLTDLSDQVSDMAQRLLKVEATSSSSQRGPTDRCAPAEASQGATSEEVEAMRRAISLTEQSLASLQDDLVRVLRQQELHDAKFAGIEELTERQDQDMYSPASKLAHLAQKAVSNSEEREAETSALRRDYKELKANVEASLQDISKERSQLELARAKDVNDREALSARTEKLRADLETVMTITTDVDHRWKEMLESQSKKLSLLEAKVTAMQDDSSSQVVSKSDGLKGEVAKPASDSKAGDAMDSALQSRLSDVLGRLDDSEVVTVECIKNVETATVAVLEQLDQLRTAPSRRADGKNSDKDSDGAGDSTPAARGADAEQVKTMLQDVKLLKTKYEELVEKSAPDGAIVERLSTILGRVSDSERAAASLQRKVESALTGVKIEPRDGVRQEGDADGDANAQKTPMLEKITELERSVEAEVDALARHHRELKRQCPLEDRVEALCNQVNAGLKEIKSEKSDFSAMMDKILAKTGSGSQQVESAAALEKKVQGLAEIMALELKELSDHQSQLKQEASRFMRLASARDVVSRVDATSSAGVGDQSQWPVSDDQQHRRWEAASSSSAST